MTREGKRERVVVAMSGGVDSSVALAVLREQDYDCVGVSMQLWDYSEKDGMGVTGAVAGGCCSLEDLADARRVADSLGVPHYVLNMEDIFRREVVDYFTGAYIGGRTPNPCIKCNEVLKFQALLGKARVLGAKYLATGHYARIAYANGRTRLLKGADPAKDQSYFLFTMTEDQLRSTLFPVGEMTKAEVRARARALGLRTSEKKESQEICFVEGGSYREFITAEVGAAPGPGMGAGAGASAVSSAPARPGRPVDPADTIPAAPAAPGPITDRSGKVLGEHSGLFNYTIGQRRGLGLSGGPFYVIEIDAANNRLVVGPKDGLFAPGLRAAGLVLTGGARLEDLLGPGISARIRYRFSPAPCLVEVEPGDSARVTFDEPQKSITPGQAVVFYRGDEVVGGAWIEEALR
jgi:tRNA-specific 2-thiouridylase